MKDARYAEQAIGYGLILTGATSLQIPVDLRVNRPRAGRRPGRSHV